MLSKHRFLFSIKKCQSIFIFICSRPWWKAVSRPSTLSCGKTYALWLKRTFEQEHVTYSHYSRLYSNLPPYTFSYALYLLCHFNCLFVSSRHFIQPAKDNLWNLSPRITSHFTGNSRTPAHSCHHPISQSGHSGRFLHLHVESFRWHVRMVEKLKLPMFFDSQKRILKNPITQ